jgi:hypothetical protein
VLVGKTELSYTYTQPVRAGHPYNLYHGTLEARPVTETTSKLVYTLVFDNSMLADDAAREKDKATRTAQFTQALQNMKSSRRRHAAARPAARWRCAVAARNTSGLIAGLKTFFKQFTPNSPRQESPELC